VCSYLKCTFSFLCFIFVIAKVDFKTRIQNLQECSKEGEEGIRKCNRYACIEILQWNLSLCAINMHWF
jgi:hypothetical protein